MILVRAPGACAMSEDKLKTHHQSGESALLPRGIQLGHVTKLVLFNKILQWIAGRGNYNQIVRR